ncbi:MAG: PQQ-binding-like beta-propeller repeat protein [Chloroflexota bacterium]
MTSLSMGEGLSVGQGLNRARRVWRGVICLLLLLAGWVLLVAPAHAAGPQPGAPWPQFKRDASRTALSPANGPASPVVAWTFTAGNPILSGPVIAADGTLYFGTENSKIYAVGPDGGQRWVYQIEGGNGPPTHPLINSKGQVVFGAGGGYIIGLRGDDGKEAWKFDLQGAPYSDGRVPVRGHPVLAAQYPNILVGADNYNVYEFEEGGAYKSVRRVEGGPVRAGPAVTPDGTIVWAGGDPAMYGGYASGGDKWLVNVDGQVTSTPVIAPDSTIFAATHAGSLYAIKSDGSPKWGVDANDKPRWSVKIGSGRPIRSSPALGADGTLYVGSDDGKLYAIDTATGAEKWNFATGAAITSSPAISANGLIYVGSIDSRLYVVNREGKQQASFQTDGAIDLSSPAIGADGTVYFGTRVGTLYALKEGGPTLTPIPAATATPARPAATPTPSPLPTDRVSPAPDGLYFPETGHNVRGPFLAFFNTYGGVEQFGYPRTEQINVDGKTVQYFQRARFEWFPQFAGTAYEIQLELLGDVVTTGRRPFPTATPVESTEDLRYFPETGHTTRGAFLRYFEANGGLDRFGYPISEELQEMNDDGTGRSYTVQYFQRARLEHHPEHVDTPAEIQLGLLGDQVLRERGWLRGT